MSEAGRDRVAGKQGSPRRVASAVIKQAASVRGACWPTTVGRDAWGLSRGCPPLLHTSWYEWGGAGDTAHGILRDALGQGQPVLPVYPT